MSGVKWIKIVTDLFNDEKILLIKSLPSPNIIIVKGIRVYDYTVEGKIKEKARPRVYNGHAMTSQDSVRYENWIRLCYQQQRGKHLNETVKANIIVFHKVPKSCTKKG